MVGQDRQPGQSPSSRGDGFAGGCLTLIVLLMQLPTAFLMVMVLVIRGWGSRTDEHPGPPPTDWVPVLWLGAFTLVTLVIAWAFLRSAHPIAGTLQLLIATVALIATITVWHEEYERAHPPPLPPCPTKAGIPCAPSDSAVDH